MVDVGLCLYGFTINHALKDATLIYILYLHKKTRFLKSHCAAGFEYFKDSLIVYTDICCFDLTVAFSNYNYFNNNKK